MTIDQPDKRSRTELPTDSFGDFQYRQALAEEMLPMIGRIYRDNVHIILYGKPLVNLSVSELMQAHRFVRETEDNELSEFETYQVIVSLILLHYIGFYITLNKHQLNIRLLLYLFQANHSQYYEIEHLLNYHHFFLAMILLFSY